MAKNRKVKESKFTRDTVLFMVGVGGIIHETIFSIGLVRPYLLLLFAYMVGLPIVSPLFSKIQEKVRPDEQTATDEARCRSAMDSLHVQPGSSHQVV